MLSFALDRPDRDAVPAAGPGGSSHTVAKRTRGLGVRNTHRPGGGPPVHQPSTRSSMGRGAEPPAAIPGEPLQPTELDPVSAAIASTPVAPAGPSTAVAPAAAAPAVRTRQRGRVKVKEGSLLAERATDEYAYIRADLRQIIIVAVGLFAALIVLWLFFTVVDPLGIY